MKEDSKLLALLSRISRSLSSERPLPAILKSIAREIAASFRANTCSLMLLDEFQRELTFKETVGLTRWETDHIRFRIGEGVGGWVAERRKSANIADVARDPRFKRFDRQKTRIGALLCSPILCRQRLLGVVTVTRPAAGAFKDADARLLEHLAAHLALEIENHRLYELSVTDPLTGLFNRRYFERRLEDELTRARRFRQAISLATADIDHFKAINDTHGHAVGDEMLRAVAEAVRGQLREYDVAARYGGDEFAVLLSNSDGGTAMRVAERIRRALDRNHSTSSGRRIRLSVSVGIAVFPEDADEPDALMERADEALYRCKRAGRNRVFLSGRPSRSLK